MIKINKKLLAIICFAICSVGVFAQNNNPSNNGNTAYSRYGYGSMAETSFVRNRGMGGIGIGLRSNEQTNTMNPASYTAIDSLTFLFDVGMNMGLTRFSEAGVSEREWSGGLDYLAMQFPMGKYFSGSLGILPYSYVGYDYGSVDSISTGTEGENPLKVVKQYTGTGGLNKVYLGFGAMPAKWVSLGVNAAYVFGEIGNNYSVSFSDGTSTPTYSSKAISARALELQFGAQFMHTFEEKHKVTLGATFTPKMDMLLDTEDIIASTESDTTSVDYKLSIPQAIGVGATYVYDDRLTVGFDFEKTYWADVNGLDASLNVKDNLYRNTIRYAVGAEYLPSLTKRGYHNKMRYRAGLNYSDSYVTVKGSNTREIGMTLGLGLPIRGQKSMVNVAFEYVNVKPDVKNMLSENYFQLNVGLTFNEFWFFKNKLK